MLSFLSYANSRRRGRCRSKFAHHLGDGLGRLKRLEDSDGETAHARDVQFAVRDVDEAGDIAAKIEKRLKFDRRFGFAESRPREHGQTQVDSARIQCVDGSDRAWQSWLEGSRGRSTEQMPCAGTGRDAKS